MNRLKPNFGMRCDGISRRDWLHFGGLTALGVGLSDWFSLRAAAGPLASAPKATSCVLVWLDGGPSHLETFDMKPDAPAEVRGPLRPTATSVPGIEICELLSSTAKLMDHVAIVRSVTSPLGEHNFASHYLLSGYQPTPALTYPGFPAVATHLRPTDHVLPSSIAVPQPNGMVGPGYLPASAGPFVIDSHPARADFQVRDLDLASGMTVSRLNRRRSFRDAVDRIRLWQPTIGRMVRFARLPAVPLDVAWSRGGEELVAGCDDGRVRRIDPDTVEILDTIDTLEGRVYAVAAGHLDGSCVVGGTSGIRRIGAAVPDEGVERACR